MFRLFVLKAMMHKRFKYIFGLTRGPVAVQGGGRVNDDQNTFTFSVEKATARINQSDSGLYLDEMQEFNLNKVPVEVDATTGLPVEGSLWQKAHHARREALKEMETALFAGLGTMNRLKNDPYTGFLGSKDKKNYYKFQNGQVVTTVIQTNNIPGHVMRIKSLALHTSLETIVPVTINGKVYEIKTRPALYTNILPTPIVIPINGEDITISYTVNEFMVGINTMCYGCQGVVRKISPYFPNIEGQEGNGLVIDMTLTCQPDNVIYENYNTNHNGIAHVLAYAARFKTAELLIESILSSGTINRFTMMDNQYLWGKRNHFRKEFQDRINWLISTDGFDLSTDNCYQCKPVAGFRKTGILT